jgi:nucleoside-diphosphate-sugar epimerase
MRIAVTGASGVLGRGIVGRLLSLGHDVVGLAPKQPDSWPSAAQFVSGDVRDAAAVRGAVRGADVVAHCAWAVDHDDVNIGGTVNVLDAMAQSGSRRIVFASSANALRPAAAEARAEEMLGASGAQWVAIRPALVVGRNVNNRVLRLLAAPALPGPADRGLQVVHSDDAVRLLLRAVVDPTVGNGAVNLAAPGELSLRQLAVAIGRPVLPRWAIGSGELQRLLDAPPMDTSRLRDDWDFTPAWTAGECAEDLALAVRGRVSLGRRVVSLPWQLTNVQDIPATDAPAADGTAPVPAGPAGCNSEFDTPIDPRFPTFVATNLSEALPGPFSPSSASVAVRGLRAGGVGIAERLRPGGLIQREIATRTVGVFAHRLYGAITAAHFMAETVPFVKPATVIASSQFFGPSLASHPVFGEQPLPRQSRGAARHLRTIRSLGIFAVNLVGLSAGSHRDTRDYVADIARLEQLAGGDLERLDEHRLLSLILLARDQVVHGWVLASGSFMLSAAISLILRGLGGRHIAPVVGPELASARPIRAIHRLTAAARSDAAVTLLLAEPGDHLGALAVRAPGFHAAVLAELALIGHRGPAEVEMSSRSYADEPELLIRTVAKAMRMPVPPAPRHPPIPIPARPVALLSARQLCGSTGAGSCGPVCSTRLRTCSTCWSTSSTRCLRTRPRWSPGAAPNDANWPMSFRPRCSAAAGRRRPCRRRSWPPARHCTASAFAAGGSAAASGSCGRTPSRTSSRGRSWWPRSPTSATPSRSPARRRW